MGAIKKGLQSRKAMCAAGVILVATGLLWFGKITADHWVDLVKWTTITYLGAQGATDGLAALKAKANS